MLCYTGFVRRNVGLIDTQIDLYREGREDTILGMKQLHEIAYAMRDAVESGDVDELGAMLRDAFVAKRRMNPHIAEHTPIEAMLSMAQAAGATGGKICGAGGGGYLLLYCRPSAQPSVRGSSSVWARSSRRSRSAPRGCGRSAATTSGRRPPRRTRERDDDRRRRREGGRRVATSARPPTPSGSSRRRASTTSSPRPRSWSRRSARRQDPDLRQRRKRRRRPAPGDGVRQHAHDGQRPAVDPRDRAHHRHVTPHRDRQRLRHRGDVRTPGRVARPAGRRPDRDLDERQLRRT